MLTILNGNSNVLKAFIKKKKKKKKKRQQPQGLDLGHTSGRPTGTRM